MKIVLITLCCCLLLPFWAAADIAAGEKLFKTTELGSTGKSCNSCHADGNGLKELNDYDSTVLQGLINICIEDALKGKPFADGTQELQDLEVYIRQFSK